MAYIPNNYKVTNDQFDQIYNNLGENDATWETLIMADYVCHHNDEDYDDGLTFFDRLQKKIGQFHEDWNIQIFKSMIRQSENPALEYVMIVKNMLADPSDVAYYGV